jgi:hypothetical protein
LTLERLVREISGQEELFGSHADCVAYLLGRAEHYVNEVIGDWEKHGHEVKEGPISPRSRTSRTPSRSSVTYIGFSTEPGPTLTSFRRVRRTRPPIAGRASTEPGTGSKPV